jgi:hypothetical protein
MATFFVGQRVRIIGCEDMENRRYIGDEQRIVRFTVSGYPVLDCHPRPNGANCCAHHNLEPILPDGHRAGDFSFSELMDKCREGEGIPA